MWRYVFLSKPHPNGPFDNTHSCHCAGPCSPHRRGRDQRRDTPLWREQKEYLSLARAPQWFKKTLLWFALTPQVLQQLIAGDERYTRGHQKVTPPQSQGGTVVFMDRATRCLWARHCGRKDRKMFQKAMGLWCQVIHQTGALTWLTDGEKRYGSLLCALCSQALRHGKRGRPRKTRPTGVKVRLKHKGSHRHKRGRKRPKEQAP
jgi:hypothetical protein